MRLNHLFLLGFGACTLAAQGAPAPIKWRGSVWTSALLQNRDMADGSIPFRPLEAGDGFALDGLTLGLDADLGKGWTLRATLMGGRAGQLVNIAAGEPGSLALPEAQLVWTGEKDKLTMGRMNGYLGMEYLDGTLDIAASRGLIFTFVDPFTQVGVVWRHTFSNTWSTDLFAFNGEDRIKDNNRSKTFGAALTYNHGGASDKYLSLHAYRGAEQDGLGVNTVKGAEGRHRERVALMGQWTWGPSTLQWETTWGQEAFAEGALTGTSDAKRASWSGAGCIYRYALTERMGIFARAEMLKDDCAVRLSADPVIGSAYGNQWKADLKATSFTLGMDHKLGPAFARLEVRHDGLNRDLTDAKGKVFQKGSSATLSMGAIF